MNIKFRKVIGDFRVNPGRIILVIFALIIGLWGVGSILVSYTILSRDLNANFVRTIPLHAAITSKDFKRLDLAALRNRPEIEKAEFRDFATLRIETHPDDWIPLWLFGVEDFNNFNMAQIFNQKGNGGPIVPEDGAMLVERDGLRFSDLKAGSPARIRAGGRVVKVPVSGIGFDPAQAPGTQDHLIYAYVNKKTYSEITGEAANQRLLIRFKNVKTKQEVQTAADGLVNYFKSLGIAVDAVKIPKFMEHPHQWQLNTLLFMEGSIGFLAFFLGAVLVSQLIAAILAKQIRQIGILKAIGASRFQVFQIYLTMVLVLGVVSGAVAIPLAIKFGYAYAYFVADILNFEVLTTSLPHHMYFYLIAASLLLPILLSLPAILKGTRISVREALSDYGIQQDAVAKKSKLLNRVPLPRNLVLAFKNTMRRKKRLAITVAAMALGVAIFSTGFNVQQSLNDLLSDVNNSMKHDVQVVLINQIPKEEALKYFSGIGNISRIETWNGGRGGMQSMVVSTDAGVGIIALPYNSDLLAFRSINGRWLSGPTEPEIVMNQEAAEIYDNPAIGSYHTLSVRGNQLKAKLVGIVEELEKPKIYMAQEQYDAFANPNHYVNSLMFVAKDKSFDKVIALKKNIEKAIEPSNLQVLYVMMQAERVKIIYDHLKIIFVTIVFFALLVLVVSAIGMASATSINIMERTREIGVLRAIGATPKIIYNLFVAEGMIVSVISIFFGLLLSWPLSIVASKFFGNLMLEVALRYSFSKIGFVITLIATLIFGWIASRIPARKAIKVSTREALIYE
ncbi:MAG: FtsX-like permease family protein [Candidatus Omnitrophica bacterium]|nr:FtsX-like permease family protein [Candidatus Omnitrophota bacterium]